VTKLKVGSLFAGIGGFDLGLERTGGFETAWFCEIEKYPTKILNQRWPGVPVYPDITKLKGEEVEPIDILTGGFPCQDISAAGRGEGIQGSRSSLWFEFARLIGELRPRYVIAENSPLLKTRGLNTVLGSLAEIGYDAEWDCIPARAFGAPHERDRIWVIAYPSDTDCAGPQGPIYAGGDAAEHSESRCDRTCRKVGGDASDPHNEGAGRGPELTHCCETPGHLYRWPREPDVLRVDDGIPDRVDRTKALGNALIPPIPEWIGHRILEWEAELDRISTVVEGLQS
jgi:DNA (cytosine-5)-methyltransferase 1